MTAGKALHSFSGWRDGCVDTLPARGRLGRGDLDGQKVSSGTDATTERKRMERAGQPGIPPCKRRVSAESLPQSAYHNKGATV
ncbi:MAG: hypothetical protein JW913_19625 [Chitinispirillaceae bacterium]|nr:hypothetical protein [Chitinispirillaceae bacterium]